VRSARILLAVLCTAAFAAGCMSSEAGSASPGPTIGPPSSGEPETESSSPSTPSVDIPPPPREISLDGIDPCTLLTEAQQSELHVSDINPGVGDSSIYKGMKECILDADGAEPFISYDLVAVTNVDVSFWLDHPTNADATLTSVEGFPAAQFSIKGGAEVDCAVAVGVAENQHLHVKMEPLTGDFTGEQICQGSAQVAAMALKTLQTMR
jgi:hypothetical protein